MYTDPTGHEYLQVGSQGDKVKTVQELLTNIGYNVGGTDGVFGNKTQSAVAQFQKNYGLTNDGVVGNQTFALLSNLNALNNLPASMDYVRNSVIVNAKKV